jgi:hypothetical protein
VSDERVSDTVDLRLDEDWQFIHFVDFLIFLQDKLMREGWDECVLERSEDGSLAVRGMRPETPLEKHARVVSSGKLRKVSDDQYSSMRERFENIQ